MPEQFLQEERSSAIEPSERQARKALLNVVTCPVLRSSTISRLPQFSKKLLQSVQEERSRAERLLSEAQSVNAIWKVFTLPLSVISMAEIAVHP